MIYKLQVFFGNNMGYSAIVYLNELTSYSVLYELTPPAANPGWPCYYS